MGFFGIYWKCRFFLRLVWTTSLFCSFCSLLCVHVHVLTPGWPVTKNTDWAVLPVLKATLIQLFLVTLLGIHWYCFLTKGWVKYWLSLLVRSRYSSTLSHESQNSSLVIIFINFFTVACRTLEMFDIWRMQGEDDISGSQPCRSKQDLWQWEVEKKEDGSVDELWRSRVMVQVISVHINSSVIWVFVSLGATN